MNLGVDNWRRVHPHLGLLRIYFTQKSVGLKLGVKKWRNLSGAGLALCSVVKGATLLKTPEGTACTPGAFFNLPPPVSAPCALGSRS